MCGITKEYMGLAYIFIRLLALPLVKFLLSKYLVFTGEACFECGRCMYLFLRIMGLSYFDPRLLALSLVGCFSRNAFAYSGETYFEGAPCTALPGNNTYALFSEFLYRFFFFCFFAVLLRCRVS